MSKKTKLGKFEALLANSRFWVLSSALICSLIILGLVQQFVLVGEAYNIVSPVLVSGLILLQLLVILALYTYFNS